MLTDGFAIQVHRGGKDRFGNPLPGGDHTVEPCAAAPAGSTELVNGQATVITHDTVYGPYVADVEPKDTVTIPEGQPIDAGRYEVEGKPQRWKNPFTGEESGCVIRLTRVD